MPYEDNKNFGGSLVCIKVMTSCENSHVPVITELAKPHVHGLHVQYVKFETNKIKLTNEIFYTV